MINEQATCRPQQLAPFVAGELPPADEAALVEHLDQCPACRQRLEQLAAEPGDWRELPELLRPEGWEPGSPRETGTLGFSRSIEASGESAPAAASLSFLAPSEEPNMLGRLGTYEVIGLVGQGGMGLVLKAFDRILHRNVAIKVLAPQLAASAVARRRFAREARAAAAVVHEHVIAIHAVAEFGGLPYLVMPYVAGKSLQQRIEQTGPLEVPEVLRIGRQIAAGLAAAHAQGLVHRDVKPANVLLENGVERVVLTDFGLARSADEASLTHSGVVAGTPQYMAPEQARGEPLDQRADLFSLGSVMYAICTGRPPFRAPTAVAVLRRISDEQPRPIRDLNPAIPDWLAEIIDKLHAKDPADRFQTAGEVAGLLEQYLAWLQQPARAMPPRLAARPGRMPARRKMWKSAARLGLIVLAVGATVGLVAAHRAGLFHSDPGVAARQSPTSGPRQSDVADAFSDSVLDAEMESARQRADEIEDNWSAPGHEAAGEPWDAAAAALKQRIERYERGLDEQEF
ncbi:MAG: protein kinase [Pirellulales bacterium]